MDRFWSKVDIKGPDECWLWQGAIDKRKSGKKCYGRFRFDKYPIPMDRAHRASYKLNVGPIPEGLYVCHKCDVPACVNPAHLFLGTQKDNVQDMYRKGRAASVAGENHPAARLTKKDVFKIRELKQQGVAAKIIASLYGVTNNYIYDIINRRAWAHV